MIFPKKGANLINTSTKESFLNLESDNELGNKILGSWENCAADDVNEAIEVLKSVYQVWRSIRQKQNSSIHFTKHLSGI